MQLTWQAYLKFIYQTNDTSNLYVNLHSDNLSVCVSVTHLFSAPSQPAMASEMLNEMA